MGWLIVAIFCGGIAHAAPDVLTAAPLDGIEVAVTVDDLPQAGDAAPGMSREEIARNVIAALKSNGVRHVYGFVNGYSLQYSPDGIEILKGWLRAGNPLGNHTFNHSDLNQVTVETYIADIERLDRLLLTLAPVSPLIRDRRVFRYPYLAEGDTLAKRDAIRSYLAAHGYKIAEVTIDYQDWAWNAAYIRCRSQHDERSIGWLQQHLVDSADRHLRGARGLAQRLFGRDIAQILLIHIGAFDALTLNGLLNHWRARGVKFVTLERALRDPAYQLNPNLPLDRGLTFLEAAAAARRVDITPFSDQLFPVENLNKVCAPKVQTHSRASTSNDSPAG